MIVLEFIAVTFSTSLSGSLRLSRGLVAILCQDRAVFRRVRVILQRIIKTVEGGSHRGNIRWSHADNRANREGEHHDLLEIEMANDGACKEPGLVCDSVWHARLEQVEEQPLAIGHTALGNDVLRGTLAHVQPRHARPAEIFKRHVEEIDMRRILARRASLEDTSNREQELGRLERRLEVDFQTRVRVVPLTSSEHEAAPHPRRCKDDFARPRVVLVVNRTVARVDQVYNLDKHARVARVFAHGEVLVQGLRRVACTINETVLVKSLTGQRCNLAAQAHRARVIGTRRILVTQHFARYDIVIGVTRGHGVIGEGVPALAQPPLDRAHGKRPRRALRFGLLPILVRRKVGLERKVKEGVVGPVRVLDMFRLREGVVFAETGNRAHDNLKQ
jgi:hypothetical protein